MRQRYAFTLIALIFSCLATYSFGQTTYTFSTVGNWNVSTNWSGGVVPPDPLPVGDFIVINANCTRSWYTTINGTLTVNAGKTLTISNSSEPITLTNNGVLNNYGTISITLGTKVINSAGQTMTNFSGGTVTSTIGGIFRNFGTFNNNSGSTTSTTFGGSVQVENGGVFNNNGTVTNGGILQISSGGTLNNNAAITGSNGAGGVQNFSGGTVNLNSGSTFSMSCVTDNYGTFNINTGGVFTNSSVLTTFSGSLINIYGTLTNSFRIVNNGVIAPFTGSTFNGSGVLRGNGSCEGNKMYTNSGTVSPGLSPGCHSFTSGYSNGTGSLRIEVNGTTVCSQFDQIQVTGLATKTGWLDLSFAFTPTVGQTFQIITATSFAGNFSGIFVTPSNIVVTESGGILTVTSVAPIELVEFSAKRVGQSAELTWQTASERNVEDFDIEKSADGRSFERIATVRANNTPSTYSATDDRFSKSAYYRLKTNDLDGKTGFSKIIFLEHDEGQPVRVNSDRQGNIWVETDAEMEWAKVVNALGQVVRTSTDQQFSIADLPTGIYIISVKTADGGLFSQQVLR